MLKNPGTGSELKVFIDNASYPKWPKSSLGIAVLNWTARNVGPSTARNAIILGNIVGFGAIAALDVWGLFSGAR
jgi:hypothetical protein